MCKRNSPDKKKKRKEKKKKAALDVPVRETPTREKEDARTGCVRNSLHKNQDSMGCVRETPHIKTKSAWDV